MKIEEQVCSLELAKKLKELGVKRRGLYSFCEKRERQGGEVTGIILYPEEITAARRYNSPDLKQFIAFTVAELGDMLPETIRYKEKGYHLFLFKNCVEYKCGDPDSLFENADTEANARAKMLIYLIENKLMEVL